MGERVHRTYFSTRTTKDKCLFLLPSTVPKINVCSAYPQQSSVRPVLFITTLIRRDRIPSDPGRETGETRLTRNYEGYTCITDYFIKELTDKYKYGGKTLLIAHQFPSWLSFLLRTEKVFGLLVLMTVIGLRTKFYFVLKKGKYSKINSTE